MRQEFWFIVLCKEMSDALRDHRALLSAIMFCWLGPLVVGVASYSAPAVGLLPAFLMVPSFVTGMHLAADCLAGERERGSLEPLLLNPIPPAEFAVGKWLAVTGISLLGIALTLVCAVVMAHIAPLRAELGGPTLLWITATLAPLAFFFSGLQLLVSAWSHSTKEAGTYLSALMLLPMLTGIFGEFFPVRPRPLIAMLPVLAQERIVSGLVRGEVPPPLWLLAGAGCAFAGGIAAVAATSRLLKSENVVFGR